MKTLQKIHKAIEIIKSKDLKKKGRNTFSKYDYYTPEQVNELTVGACHEVGLLTKFDLLRDQLGITGQLSIYDIDTTSEPIVYKMASAIPDIKATNVSQQLGGAMTYTKRYLLMNAFEIADNNLDFDTTENTQKRANKKNEVKQNPKIEIDETIRISLTNAVNQCNTIAAITKMWNANKELQKEDFFIKLLTGRKQTLINNGIDK